MELQLFTTPIEISHKTTLFHNKDKYGVATIKRTFIIKTSSGNNINPKILKIAIWGKNQTYGRTSCAAQCAK